MQSNTYKRQINHSLQGGNGAIANLNGEDILNMSFPLISIEKTSNVISILGSIEDCIRINDQLLDSFNKQRAYLLQRMFI